MRTLNIGATGMLAQQENVEVISNNIANMNTTAYTRRRTEFHDLLYQSLRRAGSTSSDSGDIVPAGVQVGLGVKTAAVYRITEQGSVTSTDNELDLAIDGTGYFQVDLPSGETGYTRDGSFQLSPDGEVVSHDGYAVQGIQAIPNEAVSITVNSSGEVLYELDGQDDLVNAGQIQLAIFANEAGLDAIGDNLYTETTASGAPTVNNPGQAGYGTVEQGYLESSNVNVVTEITDLISAQRAYEMNSKVITTADDLLATVSSMKS